MEPQGCPLITSLPGWMLRQEQWRLTWLAWLASPLSHPLTCTAFLGGKPTNLLPVLIQCRVGFVLTRWYVCSRGARARARVQVSRCCDRRKTRRKTRARDTACVSGTYRETGPSGCEWCDRWRRPRYIGETFLRFSRVGASSSAASTDPRSTGTILGTRWRSTTTEYEATRTSLSRMYRRDKHSPITDRVIALARRSFLIAKRDVCLSNLDGENCEIGTRVASGDASLSVDAIFLEYRYERKPARETESWRAP